MSALYFVSVVSAVTGIPIYEIVIEAQSLVPLLENFERSDFTTEYKVYDRLGAVNQSEIGYKGYTKWVTKFQHE